MGLKSRAHVELCSDVHNKTMMKGPHMNTLPEVESRIASTPILVAAANEEFDAMIKPVSGWDPYEVWRTRIKKAVQDDMQDGVIAG
jgi:hypothetical protein